MLEQNLMSENGYITEVKRALLREGFWGQPVRKLVEELRDHFRAKTEALEAEGHPLPEARKQAVAALGEPEAIALEWSRTLESKSWTATHPWLTVILGAFGICVYFFIATAAFFLLSGAQDYESSHHLRFLPLEGWLFLVNWMPWVVGMLFFDLESDSISKRLEGTIRGMFGARSGHQRFRFLRHPSPSWIKGQLYLLARDMDDIMAVPIFISHSYVFWG